MKIQELPFIHYLVRNGTGRDSHLLSPSEADSGASGGSFVIPVPESGVLFASYRFHFSLFMGNGSFLKRDDRKALFHGIACAVKRHREDHLLLSFESLNREPWWDGPMAFHLPRVLLDQDDFYLPFLRRTPRQTPLRYAGRLTHPDFQHAFVALEPTDPKVFDYLLDRFGISIIGCDPFTKYHDVVPV
jgi:hypothetical protein